MSVAQILEEVKALSLSELETLEQQVRLQRLQRSGKIASPEEMQLLQRINTPMPSTERFIELRQKLQDEIISESERSELLQISDTREAANAERVEAVMQLATLQGRPFSDVWKKMVGTPAGTRFIVP